MQIHIKLSNSAYFCHKKKCCYNIIFFRNWRREAFLFTHKQQPQLAWFQTFSILHVESYFIILLQYNNIILKSNIIIEQDDKIWLNVFVKFVYDRLNYTSLMYQKNYSIKEILFSIMWSINYIIWIFLGITLHNYIRISKLKFFYDDAQSPKKKIIRFYFCQRTFSRNESHISHLHGSISLVHTYILYLSTQPKEDSI